MFKLRGRLTIEHVRFKRNWIWDVLEIDWKDMGMMLNGNAINLPTSVVIPLRDKFIARKLLRSQPLFFHVMLKQGKTWFTVDHNDRNPSTTNSCAQVLLVLPKQNVITCVFFPFFFRTIARCLNTKCDFKHGFLSGDLPVDTIQVSVHVDMKWGKHTLREDRHQRSKRYRTLTKCNDNPRQVLDSLTASDLSNSGAWPPTPEPEYRPQLFNDPRNPDSS